MQYENVIFPNSVGFNCRNCGVCCKDQPPDINFKEQKRIETAGYKNFMQDPLNPSNRNISKNMDGSCCFLTKENTCMINSIKPSICSLEPFIISDFDYKTNKIFLDLNPMAIQSCKGICSGENVAIVEIGKAAQTIIRDFLEIMAEKTGLSVTDRKVAFLTKKLLSDLNYK
ncbi:MAG: YkgJ family cysteine cluster protein [Candidatus Bathyarchaeia archaeon]|jgi:Fe-S-cluster containining protein